MRMVYTFFFALAVFLNSIELGSQSDRNLNSRSNPGSSSKRQNSLEQTSAEEPSFRGRSRSPMGRPPSSEVLGYPLEELGYIRLSPRTNPSLQFEFRRYDFSDGKSIRVRGRATYVPVPAREHIVLSSSNGEMFALLEYTGILRGMYRANAKHSRVKINMISGDIDNMTSDEVRDCPVGEKHPIIPRTFTKVVTNENSLQFRWNADSELDPASSSFSARQHSPDRTSAEESSLRGRSRSPMGRPPSSEVLGYALENLGYIRLSPRTNPSLQLEFRRYVFPDGKPIRVRGKGTFVPVPSREHIVLSSSNGEIFALLEYSGFLRGIYRTNINHSRVKVNMISGAIDNMTSDEVRDCPVGESYPIFPKTFTKVVTNHNSLQFSSNHESQEIDPLFLLAELSSENDRNPIIRSRMGRPPSSEVLGYALRDLGYIRLCPRTNPNIQLAFRKYVFPVGKPISVSAGSNRFVPVPTREHIVLSASNGDILALLEDSGVLRGLYRTDRIRSRVKINMISRAVDDMTSDEIRDCPIGEAHPIFPQSFTKVVTNYDSLQSEVNPNSERNPGSPFSVRQHSPERTSAEEPPLCVRSRSPSGRPPSSKVLGYALEELGYIRLSPRTNQSLQFEFQRYVFPDGGPIRVKAGRNRYVPLPTREHIVLSASNGDIFALLEYSGFLRGIYRTDTCHSRVKMNMISGAISNMNSDEVTNCPVGERHPIYPQTFTKVVAKYNTLQSKYKPNSKRNPGSSSSAT